MPFMVVKVGVKIKQIIRCMKKGIKSNKQKDMGNVSASIGQRPQPVVFKIHVCYFTGIVNLGAEQISCTST